MYNLKTNHTNRLDVHDMIGNTNDDITIDYCYMVNAQTCDTFMSASKFIRACPHFKN